MTTHSNGQFITLEGGEGTGKSTQIALLKDWLLSQNIPCKVTREPGGSSGAEEIRQLLVTGEPDRWTPEAEALLMTAARADHVARTIKPALANGEWVVSDRFYDSSVAYQGAGRGLGEDTITSLQKWALGAFAPNLTLILDMPVEKGLSRAKGREAETDNPEDRFEKLDVEFHQKLRQAFLEIAKNSPERCHVIDATGSIEDIHSAIISTVQSKFGLS